MVRLEDLSEEAFIRQLHFESLQGHFGRFPGVSSDSELRMSLLNEYEVKYRQLDQDPPPWIEYHSQFTGYSVPASLFECENYQKAFPTSAASFEHEEAYGIAEAGAGEVFQAPPVNSREVINSAVNLTDSMRDEIEDLIHRYGWGDEIFIR